LAKFFGKKKAVKVVGTVIGRVGPYELKEYSLEERLEMDRQRHVYQQWAVVKMLTICIGIYPAFFLTMWLLGADLSLPERPPVLQLTAAEALAHSEIVSEGLFYKVKVAHNIIISDDQQVYETNGHQLTVTRQLVAGREYLMPVDVFSHPSLGVEKTGTLAQK